jgi:hypothetical protein
MVSQYQLGAARMAATGTTPTFFHSSADVDRFYPNDRSLAATVRRTRPGGENVRRTAVLNDTLAQAQAINRENKQQQQLAAWHSQHDARNRAGSRRRDEVQLAAELVDANAEVKLLRRARLKQLLEAEQQQYKRELAAKGLAIIYDEP